LLEKVPGGSEEAFYSGEADWRAEPDASGAEMRSDQGTLVAVWSEATFTTYL